MKTKVLPNIFALILILPLIDYSLPTISYFVFLPIIIYNIIFIIIKENITEEIEYLTKISIKDAYKSFLINFMFFFFISVCIYILKKYFYLPLPFNVFIVVYYFYLLQNVSFKSFGHYCLHIKINNETFVEKCKIIILNLLNSIVLYFLFFKEKFDITKEKEISFIELFLVILIINAIFRILILKHQSLFEYLLKIQRVRGRKTEI